MQLFVISGLSGSGKSVALRALEDSGYYCVDNLPADLLPRLVQHLQFIGYTHLAVSVDVRSANSVRHLPTLVKSIREQDVDVHVLFLDAQKRLIELEELFRGTLTQTSVYPREVVVRALHHQAAAVVLAHNHPSGSLQPSVADQHLTQTLKAALALVDVRVLDHFVVGRDGATSMAELGQV